MDDLCVLVTAVASDYIPRYSEPTSNAYAEFKKMQKLCEKYSMYPDLVEFFTTAMREYEFDEEWY